MFRRIRWRIAIPYVTLILLAMGSLAVYLSGLVRSAHVADLERQLTDEARLVGEALVSPLASGEPGEVLDDRARHYAQQLGVRVTIIGPDGTVLGESQADRTQMDNHLYRAEVQGALAAGQGSSIRPSDTLRYEMMYVAVSVRAEGRLVGIVRLALALSQVEATVARLRLAILAATLLTTLFAALFAVVIAERMAQPMRSLTEVVKRVAAGDLSARLFPTTRDEVGTLTTAFNDMTDRLRTMVTELGSERSRLAGILEHMADGVLITDADGRVGLMNPAAARLLGAERQSALGRSFAEVARHHRLIELWQACVDDNQEQVGSVEVSHRGPLLQGIVTPLPGEEGASCLVILQDLTEVRRLETVRRDFVSNVSHELRTPLASLKALVDTLRDGALRDRAAAQRFLAQMETEVDALTQMVEELLELSRIESGRVPFRLTPTKVADVVLPVVDRLRAQAERAGLQVSVDLPSPIPPIMADAQRIQQVVTNLMHNAIKFTPPGGQVTVSAEAVANEVVVAVRDTGVGIPEDALPRIFERFYKADRSRAGEGTGLGLSIAKHIVQGHGGRIWTESKEGKGSTFYFALPVARET
jgi:two-component system phosphate regulon sensor histidine kinase PhoR